jgi:hypothetical protein
MPLFNTYPSEAPVQSHWSIKKLAAFFIFVTAFLIGIVVLLNYRLSPLSYNSEQQFRVAQVLAGGGNVAISDANLDWRQLRRDHFTLMKDTPDIIVFGGSRWQEATAEVAPGRRFYNAFVSNDHFEDMMALTELLRATGRMPKTLLLSVRFSTFERLDKRHAGWWKSFASEYNTMARTLGIEPLPWYKTQPTEKYEQLFAADALGNKISMFLNNSEAWKPASATQENEFDVIGSDGAIRFSKKRLARENADFALQDAKTRAAKDRDSEITIDGDMLTHLEILLKYLRKSGVNVVMVQTPFHPAYFDGIKGSKYYDRVMEVERETQRIAGLAGVQVAGGFDAKSQGCEASQYRDFNHASVNCLKLLVDQVAHL